MILPNKYIQLSQSYIGLSSLIYNLIPKSGINIEKLWINFNQKYNTEKKQTNLSFQKFLLVIDFMFLIGLIKYNYKGVLFHENK